MASNRRINVLVYSGPGSTPHSLRQTLSTLRTLLSPNYAVLPLSTAALLNEPWPPTCAAIVFPGGADLPYCRALNGAGNRRIRQYVQTGGRYIGFCAGAYYASARCEFMVGDAKMEVVGDRELAFYPGAKRGLAFNGFRYQSEEGARAAVLRAEKGAFGKAEGLEGGFNVYCNGGGVFVDAPLYKSRGVEILASYTDKLDVDSGEGAAAVVYCKVGEGAALLTGPHPEFAAGNLNKTGNGPEFEKIVEALETDDKTRIAFLKLCLQKLGLQVNDSAQPVPSLSPIHLSSAYPSGVRVLLSQFREILSKTPENEIIIAGEHDTFKMLNLPDSIVSEVEPATDKVLESLSSLSISEQSSGMQAEQSLSSSATPDYDKLPKILISHLKEPPSLNETPNWNHAAFYAHLRDYAKWRFDQNVLGKHLLYGDVVTSTNTLLEKNHLFLTRLPAGTTFVASTQVSGRGRGNNVWVSPPGSLMFSSILWHPTEIALSSPVVFIQYLAAMAVVKGAKTYAKGYDKLNVRLKWPNDIYAEDPAPATGSNSSASTSKPAFVKIGGILVNSSYSGDKYGLVVGIGLNVSNTSPTTGLDALARRAGLDPFQPERLLARILTVFEDLYAGFCSSGWDAPLEKAYLDMWLHSGQVVTLETEGGMKAKVMGITRDWGLLVAEELGWEEKPTGHTITLQSDSNSFDFFRGLIKKKI